MRKVGAFVFVLVVVLVSSAEGQRRRAAPRKAPPPLPMKKEMARVACAESLGMGVKTFMSFCFVLAGRDPAQGVKVTLPPHTGPATLIFDLHNRHTYSEDDMQAGRSFAQYRAVIGVLTPSGDLVNRAAVQSEFRAERDLYDRISGGAGPGGLKAVAPIGREQIILTIPAGIDQVSLLGEVLDATTAAGRETATPGRPVAIVSNVRVEYRPKR